MTTDAHPSDPRPAQSAQARRHGPSLHRARSARRGPQSRATPNGWRCCSTARPPIAGPGASRPGCAPPGCVTVKRRSRTSTTARRDGSTRRCSSSWPPAAGSPSTAGLLVTGPCGVGQVVVILRAGAEGLPRRLHRPLRARAAPVRRSRSRPRRRSVRAAVPDAGQGRSARCSTTGVPTASPPANGAISWRSSRIAMAAAPR